MLTDKGYKRPTYDELLQGQIEQAKKLFGEDIDTGDNSILGKFIRLQVYDLAEAYEDLEKIYYARFPNTASGISLDRLVPFAGITRNLATYAQHKVKIAGNNGFKIEAGLVVVSEKDIPFYTIEDIVLEEDGTKEVVIECDYAGSSGNYIETLELENPSADIFSVVYLELVTEGQDKESDTALRRRFNLSKSGSGNMSKDSMRGAIMRVPNVQAVEVITNETEETINGLPPHSFQCYVLCPEIADYEVAEAIFSKKPLGIPCIGNISIPIKDTGGQIHEIKFSKSEPIKMKIDLVIKVNQYFEEQGKETIKENLVEYISSLKHGDDVILTTLYGSIYQVEGITETTSLKLGKLGEETAIQNVVCDVFEVPDLNKEDITIEVIYE